MKKKKLGKRTLSLLLALVMVVPLGNGYTAYALENTGGGIAQL